MRPSRHHKLDLHRPWVATLSLVNPFVLAVAAAACTADGAPAPDAVDASGAGGGKIDGSIDPTGGGTSGAAGTSGTAGASGATGTAGSSGTTDGTGGTSGTGGSTGGAGGASDDDGGAGDAPDDASSCGGPVPTTVVDDHCDSYDGGPDRILPPRNGTEGDDDNCLFHVKMTIPCVRLNEEATFVVDMSDIHTKDPSKGAAPTIDGFIGSHVMPNTNQKWAENNGIYTIGPLRFDQMGRWTVTLHMYDASPTLHTHVAFHVDVP